RATELARREGDAVWHARSLFVLGNLRHGSGAAGDEKALEEAADCFGEAGALYRSIGHSAELICLLQAAEVLRTAGCYEEARGYFGDFVRRAKPLRADPCEAGSDSWCFRLASAVLGIVDCSLQLGELESAKDALDSVAASS